MRYLPPVVIAALSMAALKAGATPGFVTALPSSKPTQCGVPRPGATVLAQYDQWQRESARRHRIDWLLAAAIRIKESFNDPYRVSTTGAVGLMQLMPTGHPVHLTESFRRYIRARRHKDRARRREGRKWGLAYQQELLTLVKKHAPRHTAKLVAIDRRFDPRWNIDRGTAHLSRDQRRFRRRYRAATKQQLLRMIVAAFYAGPGRVRFAEGKVVVPSYVTPYVDDVMGILARLKAGKPGR